MILRNYNLLKVMPRSLCHSITTYSVRVFRSSYFVVFINFYKLFPYLLYNIKYLSVISHSGGYPLSLIVTYSMISAYYALVLGSGPFPNLLFHQILLFRLYLRKYVNDVVIQPQKYTFAKFKRILNLRILILRIFDLESHSHRRSHRRCSVKKGVLRNFANFTGKHMCQRLFFNKVY